MRFVSGRPRAPQARAQRIAPALEALENRLLLSGTASISGTLWNDVNANGAWDSPDTRLSGWTVYLDSNNNGQLDAGEATTLTNPSGNYGFANLNAGTYSVRYVNQGAFSPTYNQSDHATVTLAAAQAATNVSFGLTLSNGQISGTVLESAGSSLTPLSGFGAYIDLNNNGQIDPGEPWCGTDAQGHFSFSHLTAGTYNIRIDPPHATWSFNPSGDLIQVGTDGSGPASPITFKLTPTSPPAAYQANQIVDYWLIGGSSSNDADRDVGQGLSTSGWQGFVTQAIGPDLAWGVKRIELHNPFGILSTDTAYRADQYLEAQAAGLTWLTSNFASAWKPVTSSGVEVIGYIGSPEQDPSFQALSNNPTAWNARFNASVAPLIAAGMSIAFDMGQSMSQGDLFYQAVMSLKNQGVKVYLENRPAEAESYTWNIPVISTNSFWDPSSPYVSSSTAWAAANSQLSGGVVELFQQGVSSDPSIALSQLQTVLYNGDSAGIHVHDLITEGITLAQLLLPTPAPTPQALLGDVNGDSTVNLADMLTLSRNFGKLTLPYQNGDLNGDGTVNFQDYLILTRNFGKTLTISATASTSPATTNTGFSAAVRRS